MVDNLLIFRSTSTLRMLSKYMKEVFKFSIILMFGIYGPCISINLLVAMEERSWNVHEIYSNRPCRM